MEHLTETNDYYFNCPKWGHMARIKEFFKPGEDQITPNFLNVQCSGAYRCGITLCYGMDDWGVPDFKQCVCPRLGLKEMERPV